MEGGNAMRFVSWNVNGLRACLGKGFEEFFRIIDADIVALQETKLQPHQIELAFEGYEQYWHSAVKKGYSGTAVFTRIPPLAVSYGLPDEAELGFAPEGRVITLEFETFYFVTCYTPNAQRELTRLSYRMDWEDAFRAYLKSLDAKKPVVICGDLNVAHQEIDLKNAKSNRGNAGFTDEEQSSRNCSPAALWIRSATCIRTRPAPIPGGATCTTPAPTTRGGASTISSSASASAAALKKAAFCRRSWAAIIAP